MTALQLNVAGLLKETAGAARDYTLDVPPEALAGLLEEGRPAAPLRGDLRLMRTPRSIFVRGRLETRLAVECNRCLDELELPLELDVEAEFFPEIDITTGHALPAPDDDLAFSIDHNHELDLHEVVRQNLLLALPMRALCSEACQGLCSQCGHNLNRGPCEHVGQVTDERLASLASLFPRAAQR
jgi:DUF177 domain-containing protein